MQVVSSELLATPRQFLRFTIVSFLTGAGTAVFWVIGASIVFIVMHAAFYNYESEIEDAFELQMEEI